jgi:ABC-type dipeptide/oligopeptide/nickel transport system permease component
VIYLVARRGRDLLFMLLVMALLTNLMLAAVPGGYCAVALPDHASAVAFETCRQAHEPPLWQRYLNTVRLLLQLDLGRSLSSGQPVVTELAQRWPATARLALVLPLSAWFLRLTRNAVIGVLTEPYIRAAQAKGAGHARLLLRHALPNSLAAIIPVSGLVLAGLLDGVLLIEAIFARPGLGSYTFRALLNHDYPALQGVVLLVTLFTTLANLLADLVQAYLLPQSREELLGR